MSPNEHPIARHAQTVAEALLAELDGTRAVVVATVDGFSIAHAGPGAVEPSRLAAIVSSLAALGDAASRETQIGVPRCLVVECTEGRIVVRCLQARGESIIVVVLTDQSVLLGRVMNSLGTAERMMSEA